MTQPTSIPPSPLDPADWPAFRRQSHKMLDDILDFLATRSEGPVWRPIPPAVRAALADEPPLASTPLEAVHQDFLDLVLPYSVGNTHPGFLGWVHGGGTPVGMLAEMLAGGLNANLGGRDHMPVEVERQVIEWARRLFDFPEGAGGLIVTGTSIANLIALIVARTARLGVGIRRTGLGVEGARLVAYASKAAHGCVAKAMEMAGHGGAQLRLIAIDDAGRIDVAALRTTITKDREGGLTPFLLVGTAGSVDIGAIDPLETLADVAGAEDLWFHVDGAFGALAVLAPSLKPLVKGIERADSIAFDFHKWAQVPYDAGFVLTRDGAAHAAAFASSPDYLARGERGLAAGAPWLCDFGPDLSRGFRALKVWYTLRVHGLAAIGASIERCCALAKQLADRIEAEPRLELMAPVALNIVCFRFKSADANRLNAEITADLQESGIAAPSTTVLDGRLAIRAAIVNHRTDWPDLEALIEGVLRFGKARAGQDAK